MRLHAEHEPVARRYPARLAPVWEHALLPLPAVDLAEARKGRVDDPVRRAVSRRPGRQAREQAHEGNAELARDAARGHEVVVVAARALRVRVKRVAMAGKGAHGQPAFVEARA